MHFRSFGVFAFCAVLALFASRAYAVPAVEMQVVPDIGGFTALDFLYSSTDGAEFLNYRLNVQTQGVDIQDPNQMATSDVGSDAADTFMNTVGSFLDAGPASFNFNAYDPGGFTPDEVPTSRIDWSVFDTLTGDTNDVGAGAPFHLARVLVDNEAMGTATFTAFDTLTLDTSGTPEPTVFDFDFALGNGGDPIPQLTETPADGETIDFGTLFPNTPSTIIGAIELASTGDAGSSVNIGAPIVSGPDAALFNVTGDDGDLEAGNSFVYDASFAGQPAPEAFYNAMVTFSTSLGDVSYDLTAHVTPEPTSLVLLGLAMIGLVGFRRR